MADVDDRLELRVVSGKGLPEVEGGDCNPFVVVRCGHESEQTHVESATTEPRGARAEDRGPPRELG